MVTKLYAYLFARNVFFRFNRFLFKLSLRGLGIMNYETPYLSGEKAFIKKFVKPNCDGAILDVGANQGNYSSALREMGIANPVFAFEPHPNTFKKLEACATLQKFTAVNCGLGDSEGEVKLYDYKNNSGSEHASIHKGVIQQIHKSEYNEMTIQMSTVDTFIQQHQLKKISLLKIDTEGNELSVLKGAEKSLQNNLIEMIQIEFNEMNIISRTFLKDIFDLLPGFELYRLLPNELLPLKKYSALNHEIFGFQNIVAIKKV